MTAAVAVTDAEIQEAVAALWRGGRVDVELVACVDDVVHVLRMAGFEIVRKEQA